MEGQTGHGERQLGRGHWKNIGGLWVSSPGSSWGSCPTVRYGQLRLWRGVLFGVHVVEMPAVIERFQNLGLNSQIFHYFTSNS